MAGKKFTDIALTNLVTTISQDSLFVVTNKSNTNPTTVAIKLSDLQNNVVVPVQSLATPANSNSTTLKQGSIFYDANYGYIATSNNVVKRFPLSSF